MYDSMFAENPEVTLKEEAQGFPEGARECAQFDWCVFANVDGDDGKHYWIDVAAVQSGEGWGIDNMLLWGINSETGKVVQAPNSVYRVAEFPPANNRWNIYPRSDLKVNRSENNVTVDLADFHLLITEDNTWHLNIEDKERELKLELVHSVPGFPMWHGKDRPSVITPHSINYGLHWAGDIEGTLTIKGRKVRIKGGGARERWWAVDVCPGEMGGWLEFIWFRFDEMIGELCEFKFSKWRNMALYLKDEKQYFPFPEGNFTYEHHDWAYLRQLGAFIPTRYKVTMEVEAGVLEMDANVVGHHMWGNTGEVADCPILALRWDREPIKGIFTYKDGRKKVLNNGVGGSIVRLWKPYPCVFTPGSEEASVDALLPMTIL